MKKIIALVLSVMMVLAACALAVSAVEITPVTSGIESVVLFKPDAEGRCWGRVVFTADVDAANGIDAKWGIGYFNADGNPVWWNPDSDANDNATFHWEKYIWGQLPTGQWYWDFCFHATADWQGPWYEGQKLNEGDEAYTNMWDKAKDGKLFFFCGEYSADHPVDGKLDNDDAARMDANTTIDGNDACMAPVKAVTDLKVVRAVRINDDQVVVEFNKELMALPGGWNSLRWENMDGDKPTGLRWDGETPLQHGPTAATEFYKGDKSKVLFTFGKAGLDWMAETAGNPHYEAGARSFLVFEELNKEDDPKNTITPAHYDYNESVLGADGSKLLSNLPSEGFDGTYVAIEVDYDYENKPVAPPTGDAMIATLAIAALASAGAVLVIGKKK